MEAFTVDNFEESRKEKAAYNIKHVEKEIILINNSLKMAAEEAANFKEKSDMDRRLCIFFEFEKEKLHILATHFHNAGWNVVTYIYNKGRTAFEIYHPSHIPDTTDVSYRVAKDITTYFH